MKLEQVFNNHNTCQVVLSLTNNNEVLITKDDFDHNSKFYRMSKVRLSVDFELSGVIQNDVFIQTTAQDLVENSNAIIYRTYRGNGKNDYVLYVYQGEYKLIEHYKRAVSYKKLIESTKDRAVKEPKYDIPPNTDKILTICPHIRCKGKNKYYYVTFKHDDFDNYITHEHQYSFNDVYAYLKATLFGLNVAKKYVKNITKIEIHIPNSEYAKGIYMFPTKRWEARKSITKNYVNSMLEMKQYFQEYGISICFML